MARRRTKRRTHVASKAQEQQQQQQQAQATPKSMVIRVGGKAKDRTRATLGQLTKDVRAIMEPLTASKLRERQRNRLRDYVAMAGPLGVSHLLLFSRPSPASLPSLRFVRCSRGPTLHFRILKYSLCKDIRRTQKAARSAGVDFLAPPLLVMNNFARADASSQETLLTSMFQHLFPPISAHKTVVSGIKRVLLLHRDPKNANQVELRHYAITVRAVGVTRRLRKLAEKESRQRASIPDLSSLQDISEYLLDDGAATQTSDSEADDDARVEVRSKDRRATAEKKAIKLVEIGPRLLLDLVKIEEGVCRGKILYHAHIHKTKQEEASLEQRHRQQLAVKRKRREEQQANVERKRKKGPTNGHGDNGDGDGEGESENESESEEVIDPLDELEMDSSTSE